MKEIPLTQGKVAWVDDADYEAVMQFKWYAAKRSGSFYAARNVKKSDGTRTIQYLHHFLMPGVPMVDHKYGDGLNCQRYNMRPCTKAQNLRNRRVDLERGGIPKGVRQLPSKNWEARIRFEGKQHTIGCFSNKEDAARAYDTAAKKLHGEFARLNFT